jgi:hypothetical protein
MSLPITTASLPVTGTAFSRDHLLFSASQESFMREINESPFSIISKWFS